MFEIIFSVVLSVFLPVVMISCGYWFVTNPPDNGFTGTIYGNGCLYGLLAAEAFQQILLLSVMPVTEHKLKNKFNEDGTLR